MRNAFCAALVASILLVCVCACATKVASTHAGPLTSVPADLIVNELLESQLSQLCLDVHVFGATALTDDQILAYDCAQSVAFGALSTVLGTATCRKKYESCVANPPQPVRAPADYRACVTFNSAAPSCMLSVGDFTQCLLQAAQWDVSVGARGEGICDSPSTPPAADAGTIDCTRCSLLVDYGSRLVTGGPS
jgi:hypothetical protein